MNEALEIAADCMRRNHRTFLASLIHWLTVLARDAGDLPYEKQNQRYAEVNESIHYYSALIWKEIDEIDMPWFLEVLRKHLESNLLILEELRRIETRCL